MTVAAVIQDLSGEWKFEVLLPNGKTKLFCRASFVMEDEMRQLLEKYPGLLDYRVTKEHVA